LCGHYIQEFNRRFGLEVEGCTDEAVASMLRYDWPGNVRELRNLLEGTFINLPGQHIAFIDLPEQFRQHFRDTEAFPQDERQRLLSALSATHWNVSKTAQQLHWSRMTLYRKMTKYHIVKGGETVAGTTALSAGKV
jgi:transcriptional regulator of acetoin/glycerol metabolism